MTDGKAKPFLSSVFGSGQSTRDGSFQWPSMLDESKEMMEGEIGEHGHTRLY